LINKQAELKKLESGIRTILVAIDFSYCSRLAFRKAVELLKGKNGQIIALHVIDGDFVKSCVQHRLSKENKIKKELFIEANKKLQHFLRQEKMNEIRVDAMVCEGVPFMEINRKAMEVHAETIVVGSCGNTGDMKTIFFGSTAEKILRFITRPVLCVPPETEYCID